MESQAVLDASKETVLKVNPHRTKYMIMSPQIAGNSHNIKLSNKSLKKYGIVEVFGLEVVDWIHLAVDTDQ